MTTDQNSDRPTVFVVEDESDVASTYELWLQDEYAVRRAADGPTALESIDEEVDVVLLDRILPGMSGPEVLAALRDRGYDGLVAMVTAVDPDFDIVEMGFDDYVTKPPTRDQLRGTVRDLLGRDTYTGRVREYHSLIAKRAALKAEKSPAELQASDEFAALEDHIADVRTRLDADRDRLLDDTEFVGALRDLAGPEHGRVGGGESAPDE